ncbi:MAG TPA: lysine-sensitive aspartokinase 3 [Pyrinomonadaceae bacterium]|nr:lysine-sensitive aspartokinase 3 [Pyrinomonadaceae bacterium]
MTPIVMKFGGTSLEDAAAFERVINIVRAESARREAGASSSAVVVVVSAMSRVTDALLESVELAAKSSQGEAAVLLEEHFERYLRVARAHLSADAEGPVETAVESARREITEFLQSIATHTMPRAALTDLVISYGERLSATTLAAILSETGLPALHVDARRCIVTTAEHGSAEPLMEETNGRVRAELEPLLQLSVVPVLGGFIGSSEDGMTTTLGRGGSDYTAALIGAALGAREIQIWTDVSGVLTADPRLIKQARTIPRMSYTEAAELAYFGAKVLHPKTIQPAVEQNIPVRICNSRAPETGGTLVGSETEASPHTVKAIAHKTGVTIVQITSARMLGAYGFLNAIFDIFNRHRTVVDVVTTSEVSVSMSLGDTVSLPAIITELSELGSVEVESRRAIICVVGEGLRGTPGIAARIFGCLTHVNIHLISQGASSINLTFAIDEADLHEAVSRLHAAFFEAEQGAEKAVASL